MKLPDALPREAIRLALSLTVDAAPGARLSGDPGVVSVPTASGRIVALFDGWGSWGTGMEAAARARAIVDARWREAPPVSLEAAAAEVHEIANATPPALGVDDFDCSFHGVLLWLKGSSVHLAAAGAFPVVLASRMDSTMLFRPRTLGQRAREERTLTDEELAAYPLKNVCLGPYLAGDGDLTPLAYSGPHEVPVGGAVVVAIRDIVATLESMPLSSWIDRTAAALQALDTRKWAPPVVVVRNVGLSPSS